jgi:hypothetical protein
MRSFIIRPSEISSGALAEAKCAGIALSDPCLRRVMRRVLGRGFLQGLVIRMKFKTALNFWYFCFKTKVQEGIMEIYYRRTIASPTALNAQLPQFSSFFERPKKGAKKSLAYDGFATTLIPCISRNPSRSGFMAV